MASSSLFLITVVLTAVVTATLAAPAEHKTITERDTDKGTALMNKVQIINKLLAQLDAEEENDLKNVASLQQQQQQKPTQQKGGEKQPDGGEVAAVEARMVGSTHSGVSDAGNGEGLVGPRDDRSIQVLARALERLQQPVYDRSNSAGEYLGTGYNTFQDGSSTIEAEGDGEGEGEDPQSKEIEQVILNALMRLSQEKQEEGQAQPLFRTPPERLTGALGDVGSAHRQEAYVNEGAFGELPANNYQYQPPRVMDDESHNKMLRDQAIKVVESRLMKDIALAEKLGVSVDALIQDLEDEAYKEAKLRNIERELDALSRAKAK